MRSYRPNDDAVQLAYRPRQRTQNSKNKLFPLLNSKRINVVKEPTFTSSNNITPSTTGQQTPLCKLQVSRNCAHYGWLVQRSMHDTIRRRIHPRVRSQGLTGSGLGISLLRAIFNSIKSHKKSVGERVDSTVVGGLKNTKAGGERERTNGKNRRVFQCPKRTSIRCMTESKRYCSFTIRE